MKLAWQVSTEADERNLSRMIGYGDTPEAALSSLEDQVRDVATRAMKHATDAAETAARVLAELRARQ